MGMYIYPELVPNMEVECFRVLRRSSYPGLRADENLSGHWLGEEAQVVLGRSEI